MTQDDKLQILKDILLKDEHEYALSLEQKLKNLEAVINQQPNLSKKINPIIDDKLQEFVEEIDDEYDFIISNPPFYTDNFETDDNARNQARFTSALSFEDLISNTAKILSKSGVFSVIIPFKEETSFIDLAKKNHLFPTRICRVKGTETSEIKRSLLEFSFIEKEFWLENLTIEISRHEYTEAYKNLTKDFYLNM